MNTKGIIKESINKNFDRKAEILSSVLDSGRTKTTNSRPIRLVAVIAAVVLTLTLTVTAAVLNRSVEFSLVADGESKLQGESVYITAEAKNMNGFVDGIYGFSVDVKFDNTRFDFDSTFGNGAGVEPAEGISSSFTVMANLSAADTVTVLFYANDSTKPLSFLAKDVTGNLWNVFRLHFTVKSDAVEGADIQFTPVDCEIADAQSEGGFALADDVTHVPAQIAVSAVKLGDVTGDGVVNIIDLVRFKKYSAGALGDLAFISEAADCDKNGTLEVALDMVQLRKLLFRI